MAALNKVLLIGNLTRDPELRVTPKGSQVCQVGIATSRKFKDETGNLKEETTFVELEAWGKTAELISRFLGRGSPCMIEGRLKLEQWEDKESHQKRQKIKVVVENVQFIGSPRTMADKTEAGAEDDTNPELDEAENEAELVGGGGGRKVPF